MLGNSGREEAEKEKKRKQLRDKEDDKWSKVERRNSTSMETR